MPVGILLELSGLSPYGAVANCSSRAIFGCGGIASGISLLTVDVSSCRRRLWQLAIKDRRRGGFGAHSPILFGIALSVGLLSIMLIRGSTNVVMVLDVVMI